MTPDEYCDTIRNIAFDRETTKAAFAKGVEVGFAAGQADAKRRELERQVPVAWLYWATNGDGTESAYTHVGGVFPSYVKTSRDAAALYERPIPSPDVRELVEAADAVVNRWDSPLWSQQGHTGNFIARLRAALTKHRGQS